jgi:Putative peptidoglycan binding domain
VVAEVTGNEPLPKLGDFGEDVMFLQVRMHGIGYLDYIPDGTFDMRTENAVRKLQSDRGLDNDGMVTRETWEAIVYFEQQAAIQYMYQSPYDARSQIVYDTQQAEQQAYWEEQYAQYGQDDAGYEQTYVEGQFSQDGRWQLRGGEWQPVGEAAGEASDTPAVGSISADGYYRWDGTDWELLTAESFVGELSPDGYWRWDGTDWQRV